MKISTAIFDLDGTVIDSEDVWGRAFCRVLKNLGAIAKSEHPEEPGFSIKESWKRLIPEYGIKTEKTLDELRSLTYSEYEKEIPQIGLQDNVVDLIEDLKESGIVIVLATGTIWEIADKIMMNLKIENLFDNIVTGDEVLNQKPDPEIFNKVIEKLDVDPNECLVFEDSLPGILAAKEAGMKVIAIDPTGENAKLEEAHQVIGSFSEVTPKVIDSL